MCLGYWQYPIFRIWSVGRRWLSCESIVFPTLSSGVKSQLRFDPWELGKYGRRLDGEEVSRADTDPVLIKHQIMPPATQDTTSRSESHGRFSENNFQKFLCICIWYQCAVDGLESAWNQVCPVMAFSHDQESFHVDLNGFRKSFKSLYKFRSCSCASNSPDDWSKLG